MMWSQCRWVSSTDARYGLFATFASSSAIVRAVTMSPYSRTPVPRSNTIGVWPGASSATDDVLPPYRE